MTTIDEETLRIYEEIKVAQRDGNLLMCANKLAQRLVGTIERSTPQPRSMEQQISRLDNSPVGRQIPASRRESIGREVMDGVRVSNL